MSNANTTTPGQDNSTQYASDKGKGKEPVQDVNMDEAGDDDEEDSSEDEVDEVKQPYIGPKDSANIHIDCPSW